MVNFWNLGKPKKQNKNKRKPAEAGFDRAGDLEYKLIRSDRRSLSIEIKPDGALVVRAPRRATPQGIRAFVLSKQDWVGKHRAELKRRAQEAAAAGALSEAEIRDLAERARLAIPARVAHYAALMGVSPAGITIRCQKTRWGSCSRRRTLSFNCLLMLTPPEVLDSVVVHELCHIKEMNHSRQFYALVRHYYPEYDSCDAWLKEHGPAILARAHR